MNLEDLFVSHKQVDPISFTDDKPELPNMIYLNLERAQRAAQQDWQQQPEEDRSSWVVGGDHGGVYNWKVRSYVPPVASVPQQEQKENQEQKEKEENKENYEFVRKDSKTKSKTESKTLKSYRNRPDYKQFKKQLDIFIDNNPQYANIKDSLDYLAALESRYKMNVENYAGSKALGWFQFMDTTRRPYNTQTRHQFANDAQAQLLAAARYYTDLQKQVKGWGGDPDDFVTMYGAWWRPESARIYIQNPAYNYKTEYNEDLHMVRRRAQNLFENE